MARVIVKTQAELAALPKTFSEYTIIELRPDTRTYFTVEARENSSVVARENSSVEAWENSSVVARENSSVVARENSSVVAWENSSVVAWGNSSVVARGNSSVVARENSSVEAWGNSGVHIYGDGCAITLWAFAVAWLMSKAKVKKKSKTCVVIKPTTPSSTKTWIEQEGVDVLGKYAIVFKRVSDKFQTQEGTRNETIWSIGTTLSHTKYRPKGAECGEGKFHACSRPYFCDEFRSTRGDRYVAIKVPVASLHYWGKDASYRHKVAFGEGEVMYECDRFGKKK